MKYKLIIDKDAEEETAKSIIWVLGSKLLGQHIKPESKDSGFFHFYSLWARTLSDISLTGHCLLRINDVALCANGTEHLSHIGATVLHFNTKVLVNQGLFSSY